MLSSETWKDGHGKLFKNKQKKPQDFQEASWDSPSPNLSHFILAPPLPIPCRHFALYG